MKLLLCFKILYVFCVDKSNDFQFTFPGLHRSLAKQDNFLSIPFRAFRKCQTPL